MGLLALMTITYRVYSTSFINQDSIGMPTWNESVFSRFDDFPLRNRVSAKLLIHEVLQSACVIVIYSCTKTIDSLQ